MVRSRQNFRLCGGLRAAKTACTLRASIHFRDAPESPSNEGPRRFVHGIAVGYREQRVDYNQFDASDSSRIENFGEVECAMCVEIVSLDDAHTQDVVPHKRDPGTSWGHIHPTPQPIFEI